MLIAAVEPIYLKAISQPYVGLGNRTLWELLDHLYKTYAKITATNLKNNDKKMNAPYNPNMPFEFLIEQIQNAVDFAAHSGTPYTQNQIQATAYNLVFIVVSWNRIVGIGMNGIGDSLRGNIPAMDSSISRVTTQ